MAVNAAKQFLTKYPLARGMLAYSITWPTGCLIQQTIDGKRWGKYWCTQFAVFCFLRVTLKLILIGRYPFLQQQQNLSISSSSLTPFPFPPLLPKSNLPKLKETFDWTRCAQFSLYGTYFVAPTMYTWIKFMSKLFPKNNWRTAIMRTALEQTSYGPAATASFFFIFSLIEKKTVEESKQEVRDKFWPTYKVSDPAHSVAHAESLLLAKGKSHLCESWIKQLTEIHLLHLHTDGHVLLVNRTDTKLHIHCRTKPSTDDQFIRLGVDNIFGLRETKVSAKHE